MFSYDFTNKPEDIFFDKRYPNLVRLCRNCNNPGWTYNYHIHKDATEIVYIADGKAEYTVNMETHQLEKGQLLIIEKGVLHSIKSDKDNPVDAWTCIINNYRLKNFLDATQMLSCKMYKIINTGEHEDFIKHTLTEMRTFCLMETNISHFTCNALLTSLVSVIFNLLPKENHCNKNLKSSFVKDILIYISEHYTEPITIKQLSEIFHMSPSYISHAFVREYGVSPINYVIDRRICEAKWLFINTNESLTSISQKVGYDNISYFSKLFTKRVNYSPLEYREIFSSKI